MPTVVSRTYSDHATAQAAAAALKEGGFGESAVHVKDAQGGQASVGADCEFGEGQRATRILDRFNPVGAPVSTYFSGTSQTASSPHRERTDIANDPAPFSQAVGAPLLSDNPAPFSKWLGLPVLSESQAPSASLSDNPAPFSSALGLPTLLADKAPAAKLQSDDPAPLSKAIGVKTLSDDPTPFSSWLKLPVLSKDKHSAS